MFYTSKQDSNLTKDMVLNEPDLFISKILFEGTGVYAEGSGATDTLTPAVSPAWTINEFASTVGINLEVVDQNGKLAYGKIISNTATSITFDREELDLDEDGATSPTLTDTNVYTFRILSPSSVYKYGDFFGYVNDLSLGFEQEKAEYKKGIPRELIVEDLIENINTLTGTVSTIANEDILAAIFGADAFGLQTGQFELGFGSQSFSSSFYRAVLAGKDRTGRSMIFICHKIKFSANGELSFSEEDFKSLPFTASVFVDTLRENPNANKIRIIRTDT